MLSGFNSNYMENMYCSRVNIKHCLIHYSTMPLLFLNVKVYVNKLLNENIIQNIKNEKADLETAIH